MSREERCRRALRRDGFVLLTSRDGYMIVDENNCVFAGGRFELTLEDVEAWLAAA